jgi:hypothetical protein
VNYATSNGYATAGSDYTAASGTLTFNPGELSQTFNVDITDDSVYEGVETVNLALTTPGNATLGSQNTAVLTITDNETQPTLAFSSATYTVAENAGPAIITVNLSGASAQTITVNYATSNGSATAGSDYTAASGTLTFNPGNLSKNFNVTITDDSIYEGPETVNLALSTPGNATLGSQNTAVLAITDNETPPTGWTDIFQDHKSGTELRINTINHTFEFVAQDGYDSGVVHAMLWQVNKGRIQIIGFTNNPMATFQFTVNVNTHSCKGTVVVWQQRPRGWPFIPFIKVYQIDVPGR